jgi:two-component system chemotaxis response regulator CheB
MTSPEVRVLVCDDSSLVRKLLTRMLEKEPGIRVIGEAVDGHDCIERVLDLLPDLVLIDLEMPVMDGIECIKEARRRGLTTPFLVVSEFAASGESRTQAALAAGAEGFLVRPHAVMQVDRIQPELARRIHQFQEHHHVGIPTVAPTTVVTRT